jgi:hypothetical protein
LGQNPANVQTIILLDMSGKLVRSYSSTQTTLNLSGVAQGIYQVQIGHERARLVVE